MKTMTPIPAHMTTYVYDWCCDGCRKKMLRGTAADMANACKADGLFCGDCREEHRTLVEARREMDRLYRARTPKPFTFEPRR